LRGDEERSIAMRYGLEAKLPPALINKLVTTRLRELGL
jgi:hypothetical protein